MKIAIVDPSLTDIRGHHYAVTRAITLGAVPVARVFWLVNKRFGAEEIPDVHVRRVFEQDLYSHFTVSPLPTEKSLIRRFIAFLIPLYVKQKILEWLSPPKDDATQDNVVLTAAQTLIGEVRNLGLSADDHVLIHTADGDAYRMILDMVLQAPLFENGPTFHLCTPYDDIVMPRNNIGFSAKTVCHYLKKLSVLDRKVFLYAENELLADDLSKSWDVPIEPLELPCVVVPKVGIPDPLRVPHVVYLGAAREEKGFYLLPEVVESLIRHSVDVQFTIQCSPQKIGYTPAMKAAVDRLRSIEWPNLHLIEQPMSMEEYYGVLASADAVMLCYDRARYRVRGSGIVVEAVTFDKVIIATPDTFPAHLGGDAVLLAADTDEMVAAIRELVSNLPEYRQRAAIVGSRYRESHLPEQYVSRFISRLTGVACKEPEIRLPIEEGRKSLDLKEILAGRTTAGEGIVLKRLL